MTHYNVVIVGAGHAGVQLATSLVQGGYAGSIALLSAENVEPYERPPLSKSYLAGEQSRDDILFRPSEYWANSPVDLQLGAIVTSVDPEKRVVTTAAGSAIHYDYLVWAAGGHARKLSIPGHGLEGVLTIRDLPDVDRLRALVPTTKHAVVIGGGYIGLEVAAQLRAWNIDVTLVEAQDRLLARVTSPPVSDYYAALHRDRGVRILLQSQAEQLVGENGMMTTVRLSDGTLLPADLVIVGIGLVPNVGPIAAAGGQVDNGIVVDEYCQTSLPHVFAIGDLARHRNEYAGGEYIRLESVQNAVEQAKVVAHAIMGNRRPYSAVPWFWSNQYDVKLKTVGLLNGYDDYVVRGNPESGKFSVVYLRNGRVIAIDCINTVADFAVGRKLIEQGLEVNVADLKDVSIPLKSFLAANSAK